MARLFFVVLYVAFILTCYAEHKKDVKRIIAKEKVFTITCNKTSYEIVHVTATNEANTLDVIHYLFTGIGRPTIVTKHTFTKTNLRIYKNNVCNKTGEIFSFTPDNSGLSGLIITKVLWYSDPHDKIRMPTDSLSSDHEVSKNFMWKYHESKDSGVITFHGSANKYINSSLNFKVEVHDHSGHAALLPHNPIHANLTEFTLEMDKLATPDKHTRYAVEIVFFSSEKHENSYETDRTIDDEYTPGIFSMWTVTLPLKFEPFKRSFASWKPVAYTNNKRSHDTQSLAHFFEDGSEPLHNNGVLDKISSKAWTIVSNVQNINYYAVNITFGTAKDGCYNLNRYMSWTGMFGHGTPPRDEMSAMVLTVLLVGLVAPVVAILVGAFVLLVRKVRLRRTHYDIIN